MTSAPTPALSEKDARRLTQKIVEQIHALGAHATEFGVYLQPEGFSFVAEINGRRVWVQTGQGNFTYQRVAADLVAMALSAPPPPLHAPQAFVGTPQ